MYFNTSYRTNDVTAEMRSRHPMIYKNIQSIKVGQSAEAVVLITETKHVNDTVTRVESLGFIHLISTRRSLTENVEFFLSLTSEDIANVLDLFPDSECRKLLGLQPLTDEELEYDRI